MAAFVCMYQCMPDTVSVIKSLLVPVIVEYSPGPARGADLRTS